MKPISMNHHEARAWIKQVGGVVYRNKSDEEAENAWVAVVRTPAAPWTSGKIILAFGQSMQDAACAAEAQWDEIWGSLSQQVH